MLLTTVNMNIFVIATTENKIRIFNDFEDLNYLKSNGMLNQAGNLQNSSGNISSYSFVDKKGYKDTKAFNIKYSVGNRGNFGFWDISNDDVIIRDWTGADYIQFWVKNTSNGPVDLDWFAVNLTSWFLKDGSKYELKESGSNTWKSEVVTGIGQNGTIRIASNYEGLLRISLSNTNINISAINLASVNNFTFRFNNWATNSTGSLYVDDIAITGVNLNKYADTTNIKTTIIDGAMVRVLNNFEDSNFLVANGMLDQNGTLQHSWYNMSTYGVKNDKGNNGSRGLEISYLPGNWEVFGFWKIDPNNYINRDWSGAEYVQFWTSNVSNGNINIDSIGVNGSTWILKEGSKFELRETGSDIWETFSVTGSGKDASITIPQGFNGFARINLSSSNINIINVDFSKICSFGFQVNNLTTKSTGDLYIDDVGISGTNLYEYVDTSNITTIFDTDYFNYVIEKSKIRVLIDFENQVHLNNIGMLNSDGKLITTWGNMSTYGVVENKGYERSKAFNINYSPGNWDVFGFWKATDTITIPNELKNWSGAQYMQFWATNTSDGDVELDWFGFNGDNWFLRSGSKYELLGSETDIWESYDFRGIGQNATMTLPAGFKGFARINITSKNINIAGIDFSKITALSFRLNNWFTNSTGDLYIDDLSIIGTKLESYSDTENVKTFEEDSYYPVPGSGNEELEEIPVITKNEKVRNIFNFNEDTQTLKNSGLLLDDGTFNIWCDPEDAVPEFSNYTSVAGRSLKFVIPVDGGFSAPVYIKDTKISEINNWKNAQYLQFWVNNYSETPVYLTEVKIAGSNLSPSAEVLAKGKNQSYWGYLKTLSNFSSVLIEIPKYFEGIIRIPLVNTNFIEGWVKPEIVNYLKFGFSGYVGNCIFLDDISIVGTDILDVGIKKVQNSDEYFKNLYGLSYSSGKGPLYVNVKNNSDSPSIEPKEPDDSINSEEPEEPVTESIYTLSLNNIISTIRNNLELDTITIKVNKLTILTKEMQQILKEAEKSLKIQLVDDNGNVLMIWQFEKFSDITSDIDLSFDKISLNKDKINGLLTGYSDTFTISIKNKLNNSYSARIILPNKYGFNKNDSVSLLSYNEEMHKLENIKNGISMTKDQKYLSFKVLKGKDYILAKPNKNIIEQETQNYNFLIIIIPLFLLGVISVLGVIFYKKKIKK